MILVTILTSLLVGGFSAVVVNALVFKNIGVWGSVVSVLGVSDSDDIYFAQSVRGASLPDLTMAAQRGVDAVVNVEILQRVEQRSVGYGGRRVDPLEFFFGPRYSERGRRGDSRSSEPSLRRTGGGSGVVISGDGYIVTNNHVIDGADKIQVTLNSGDLFDAKLIGTDLSTDIALLKIEPTEHLPFLLFGDSEGMKLGEWVLAVGNPYGLNSTVTAGIISATGRSLGVISRHNQMGIEAFIQTDAAVNAGNSGGALITADGSLIGINTLIKSPTGSFTGYSFAVPSNIARKVVGDIGKYGIVQRALLGVVMQEISNEWLERFGARSGITEREGVYVVEVTRGSAAEAAGVLRGDVLIEFNGQRVTTSASVQQAISTFSPGDRVNISIKRGGKVKQIGVTLRNRSGNEELVTT